MSKPELRDCENESGTSETGTKDLELTGEESFEDLIQKAKRAEQTENKTESAESESDYSIINYFMKTPAVTIALVSGAVAVVSFLINYATYMQTARKLQYWNVDPSIVSSSDKQIFYLLCFSIVFFLLSLGVSMLISQSFTCFFPFQVFAHQLKMELKKYKKCYKRALKNTRAIEKRLKKISPSERKALLLKESELTELKKRCVEGLQKLISIKKKANECKRHYRKKVFKNLAVAILLLLLSYFIQFQTDFSINIWQVLLKILVFTVFHFLFCCFVCLLKNRIEVQKCIKDRTEDDVFSEFEVKMSDVEYPLERLSKHGIESMLSDRAIVLAFLNLVISILIVFFLIAFVASAKPDSHRYKSATVDGIQYVAVYTSSESMVLEEAIIDNGKAKVFTTKQMVVPISGIKYEVVEFDDVERIESPEGEN